MTDQHQEPVHLPGHIERALIKAVEDSDAKYLSLVETIINMLNNTVRPGYSEVRERSGIETNANNLVDVLKSMYRTIDIHCMIYELIKVNKTVIDDISHYLYQLPLIYQERLGSQEYISAYLENYNKLSCLRYKLDILWKVLELLSVPEHMHPPKHTSNIVIASIGIGPIVPRTFSADLVSIDVNSGEI